MRRITDISLYRRSNYDRSGLLWCHGGGILHPKNHAYGSRFVVFCWVGHGRFCPYRSGLLHWSARVKQSWRILALKRLCDCPSEVILGDMANQPADQHVLWSAPQQKIEQTNETPVIWDAIVLIMTSLQWHIKVQTVCAGCSVVISC